MCDLDYALGKVPNKKNTKFIAGFPNNPPTLFENKGTSLKIYFP